MKDNCFICGEQTPYSYDTSMDYRDHYIEGAGQLCKTCYDNLPTN
jgi:hypothetical protein